MSLELGAIIFITAILILLAGAIYGLFKRVRELENQVEQDSVPIIALSRVPKISPTLLKNLLLRNVTVHTKLSTGSGGYLGNDLYTSARHVVINDILDKSPVYIDSQSALIAGYSNAHLDVVVLRKKTEGALKQLPPIRFYEGDLYLLQEVIFIGNPEHHKNFCQIGRVIKIDPTDEQYFTVHIDIARGGISGGFLYTTAGEFLGIAQRAKTDSWLEARSSKAVKKLMQQHRLSLE